VFGSGWTPGSAPVIPFPGLVAAQPDMEYGTVSYTCIGRALSLNVTNHTASHLFDIMTYGHLTLKCVEYEALT